MKASYDAATYLIAITYSATKANIVGVQMALQQPSKIVL